VVQQAAALQLSAEGVQTCRDVSPGSPADQERSAASREMKFRVSENDMGSAIRMRALQLIAQLASRCQGQALHLRSRRNAIAVRKALQHADWMVVRAIGYRFSGVALDRLMQARTGAVNGLPVQSFPSQYLAFVKPDMGMIFGCFMVIPGRKDMVFYPGGLAEQLANVRFAHVLPDSAP
jgi:hypothetical protein